MGANLAPPVQQANLLVTLALAILVLGEHLTLLRVIGIGLVVLGPALTYEARLARIGERNDVVLRTALPIEAEPRRGFQPNYAEGYLFALLSATGYGIRPVLIRLALENKTLVAGLAGGLISYSAAALAFALILLWPG
jgi:drug/metabolite transporter (DMT)-like permease